MQSTSRIRVATVDDFERIVELENMCFSKVHAYTRRQLRYLLFKANSTILVETRGALLRGFLIILYRRGTTVAGLESINVDPSHRKKGIGLRLLSAAEDHLRKIGISKLRLEVAITNKAAIQLYEHAGFEITMVLKEYYHFDHEGSRDAYRMVKILR